MSYSKTPQRQYILERKNAQGFTETVIYTGSLKQKPKGWKVQKFKAPEFSPAPRTGSKSIDDYNDKIRFGALVPFE